MSQVYEFISTEPSPVLLDDQKDYLKITNTNEDKLIQSLINSATDYAEKYTGRTFRVQTWNLLLDEFTDRICLNKNVQVVNSIKYPVLTVQTTVDAAVYYLKKEQQGAIVLLADGQSWPSDMDEIEQGITINFDTGIFGRTVERIRTGILRHVTHMYMNRGDCDDECAAKQSGADKIYDLFRIARV